MVTLLPFPNTPPAEELGALERLVPVFVAVAVTVTNELQLYKYEF